MKPFTWNHEAIYLEPWNHLFGTMKIWSHTEKSFRNTVNPNHIWIANWLLQEFKPNLDSNCTLLIDLSPNGIPYDAKSIGNVQLQSKFGLYQRDEGSRSRRVRPLLSGSCVLVLIFPRRVTNFLPALRNIFKILLNQPEIRLYLPFFDWYGSKRTSVRIHVNRKMVNTIW